MPAFACCTGVPRLGKKKDHHLCRLVCFWVRKKNTRGKKWEVGVLPLKSQMLPNPTRDEATQRLLEIPPRTWKNTPSHQGTRTRHPAQVPKYIHHDMGFAARHW